MKNLNNKKIEAIVNNVNVSKSKRFIELYNNGLDIKEIASLFNVRYNFVYNVISNYTRINNIELRVKQRNGETKKDKIVELFNEGKSNVEICKALKCNYQYVYKVTKALL